MKYTPREACEFPNDNSALHFGVAWICLDPVGAARAVARPQALARVGGLRIPSPSPAASHEPASTPPVLQETPIPPPETPLSERLLAEVSTVFTGRAPAEVPPPPTHAYLDPRVVAGAPAVSSLVEGEAEDAAIPSLVEAEAAVVATPSQSIGPELVSVMRELDAAFEEDPAEAPAATDSRSSTPSLQPAAVSGVPHGSADFVRVLADLALRRGATRGAALIPLLFAGAPIERSLIDAAAAERLGDSGVLQSSGESFLVSAQFLAEANAWADVLSGRASDLSACGTLTLDEWATTLVCQVTGIRETSPIRRELRRQGVLAFGFRSAA